MELEYSTRGLLTGLFRQQRKIILVGTAVVGLGLFYLLSMPKVYESSASMLVKFGQDARPNLSVTGNAGGEGYSNDRAEILQSNISIIYSNDLLRDVVMQVGAERMYPGISASSQDTPENLAIANLQRGGLVASTGGRNNVIDITIRNPDPQMAALVAQTLVEKYIQRQADIYNKPQTGFLQQQIAEAAQKLEDAQKKLQDFKQESVVSDIDVEIEQLMRQKTELSSIAFQAVTQAQENLAQLEAKEVEMRSTYRPNSPVMVRMRESIEAARAQVLARQNDLNAVQDPAAGSALAAKLQTIDERLAYLEAKRPAYNELDNNVRIAQDNYKYYQQRGEEARANDILNQQSITRISVIDAPDVPSQPAGRHRTLLLVAFILTGGLAGLAVAVLFELLDDRFRTPEQLSRRLGVPVLATFSRGDV